MKLLLLCISLFVCIANAAPEPQTGIRVNFTLDGLDEIERVVEPLVTQYIESLEPILLPDVQVTEFWPVLFNLSNMAIRKTSHSSFDFLVLPGTGLRMSIGGLAASLNYTVDWEVITSGEFSGLASFNGSNITIDFQISASSAGLPLVVLQNMVLNISNLDPGLPSWLAELIAEALQSYLESYLNTAIPSLLTPSINEQLSALLSNLSMQTYLDPQNLTVLDYFLVGNPQFTPTFVAINFTGNAYAPLQRSSCPYTAPQLPNIEQSAIRIYVSEYVLDCALLAFIDSGVLRKNIDFMLANFLPMDGRIALDLTFSDGTDVLITQGGLSAALDFQLIISRTLSGVTEQFLTIPANVTSAIELGVAISPPNITVQPQITTAETLFGQVVAAQDFPQIYSEELQQTNFTELAAKADQFLASTIIPALNAQLQSGISFSLNYTDWLSQPEVQFYPGAIFFGTGLISPKNKIAK